MESRTWTENKVNLLGVFHLPDSNNLERSFAENICNSHTDASRLANLVNIGVLSPLGFP